MAGKLNWILWLLLPNPTLIFHTAFPIKFNLPLKIPVNSPTQHNNQNSTENFKAFLSSHLIPSATTQKISSSKIGLRTKQFNAGKF